MDEHSNCHGDRDRGLYEEDVDLDVRHLIGEHLHLDQWAASDVGHTRSEGEPSDGVLFMYSQHVFDVEVNHPHNMWIINQSQTMSIRKQYYQQTEYADPVLV